jgi:hypothetical protein
VHEHPGHERHFSEAQSVIDSIDSRDRWSRLYLYRLVELFIKQMLRQKTWRGSTQSERGSRGVEKVHLARELRGSVDLHLDVKDFNRIVRCVNQLMFVCTDEFSAIQ